MKISVVIPLLNEEESLNELFDRIKAVCDENAYSFEVVFVDDGSTDKSMQVLKELKAKYKDMIKIISFRKNYGKSGALSEGFKIVSGEFVITMDADLQDDPAEIPNLINKLEEGYDLVSGWKKVRHDPISKTLPSKLFNYVTSKLTGINIHDFNCGLKAYRKEVIDDIEVYGEMHRYLPVLAKWEGYKISEIPVKHHPRKFGVTKFGLNRFFHGFFDLFTVLFLTRYKKTPLYIFGMMGFSLSSIGLIIELYLTIYKFLGHGGISTRPLFFLGILLLIVGIQLFSLGLLAEMISAHFTKQQNYTIKEKIE
ncbi:MAG: glycosyltransferase family 2 protein [Calditrichia bacterium]|nr:glycosyltransferase family 2 protein [Calditrichia bacterium]